MPSSLSRASIFPLIACPSIGSTQRDCVVAAILATTNLCTIPRAAKRPHSLSSTAIHAQALVRHPLPDSRPGAARTATLGEAQIGFAADRTLVIDGRTYQGKIWAMPGKERHEQAIQAFRPIFLLRTDSPLGQIVLPQLKTIVQFALPPEARLLVTSDLKKRPVGQENVNGIATTRYAIDDNVPEG